jgi:predicted flap endonuclease-1-like 5' DNA nuclease
MQDIAEIVEANWMAFALALLIGLLVAWWLWGRRSARLRTRHRAPDALDEGAAPAARNQALIDAPSAVTAARLADSGPDIFAGIGGAIAAGAAREVEAAAPPPVPPPPEPVREPAPTPKPAPKTKAPAKPKATAKPKAEPKPKAAAKPKPAPKAKAAPKPKSVPSAAPVVEPPPPPAKASGPDDLAQIKGLGPKLQALLPTLGVTSFAQIAGWDDAEIDRIDAQLGVFQGRIRKDNWVAQAQFLAGGDVAGYEAKFGKL